MKAAKISDKIFYIGVNDRTTQKFEGMWPLPIGVSYNSYLVCGEEKSAIIDGVEVSNALRQIAHIREILGERHPDYLIINHMEPDHSGAIAILRQAFPEIKIVGNAQTLGMIKGYYGLDDNTVTIKDGETLSLGENTTLSFHLTPMVHWPETMVTYLKEEQTLFSGDAFGCFGALNGAVIDSDMNTARYYPEMIRYYASIVGKYGAFVQKAIAKLQSLPIGTICTTHGPVWRSEIPRVLDLYHRLSLYEPLDNGATIVYGSMYGNTAEMAEEAAAALAAEGVKEIAIHNASISDLSMILADIFTHRILILASPTYSDTLFPPIEAVVQAIATRGIKNRKIGILGSCTWSERATRRMTEILATANLTPDMTPIAAKHNPSESVLAQVRSQAKSLI